MREWYWVRVSLRAWQDIRHAQSFVRHALFTILETVPIVAALMLAKNALGWDMSQAAQIYLCIGIGLAAAIVVHAGVRILSAAATLDAEHRQKIAELSKPKAVSVIKVDKADERSEELGELIRRVRSGGGKQGLIDSLRDAEEMILGLGRRDVSLRLTELRIELDRDKVTRITAMNAAVAAIKGVMLK